MVFRRITSVFLLSCAAFASCYLVACTNPDRDLPRQLSKLESENPKDRERAALNISALGPDASPAIGALGKHMEDPSWDVRFAVHYALDKIDTAEARALLESYVPAYERMIMQPDPELRWNAVTALGYMGPNAQHAVPLIAKALGDPEDAIANAAAMTLRKIGTPEALAIVSK